MSAPKLSLRSEMSSRNSTNVSDIRKQSLFGIMDKDGTGTIDKAEFDKLIQQWDTSFIFVSNEIGSGVHAETAMGRGVPPPP